MSETTSEQKGRSAKAASGAPVDANTNVKVIAEDVGSADNSAPLVGNSENLMSVCDKIIHIITPVTLGCLYTCLLVRLLELNLGTNETILDKTLNELGVKSAPGSQSTNFAIGFIMVTAVCFIIIVLTLIVLFIFYMEWHVCLAYYSYIPTLITFIGIMPIFIYEILTGLNWFALDIFTLTIVMWNFIALGVISVFGPAGFKAPLTCQQFFLIHNSSLLSVLIIQVLPGWAPWLLLVFIILWDSFAMLSPIGPLNLILKMADRHGMVEMPGMVYTTDSPATGADNQVLQQQRSMIEHNRHGEASAQPNDCLAPERVNQNQLPTLDLSLTSSAYEDEQTRSPKQVATINSDSELKPDDQLERRPKRRRHAQSYKSSEESGTNIGLGDFVFYNLLVGLTAKGDEEHLFYTTLASLLAVQVGLIITLIILVVTRRSLPAVPVSVGLGVVVAWLTMHYAAPFSIKLATQGVFI